MEDTYSRVGMSSIVDKKYRPIAGGRRSTRATRGFVETLQLIPLFVDPRIQQHASSKQMPIVASDFVFGGVSEGRRDMDGAKDAAVVDVDEMVELMSQYRDLEQDRGRRGQRAGKMDCTHDVRYDDGSIAELEWSGNSRKSGRGATIQIGSWVEAIAPQTGVDVLMSNSQAGNWVERHVPQTGVGLLRPRSSDGSDTILPAVGAPPRLSSHDRVLCVQGGSLVEAWAHRPGAATQSDERVMRSGGGSDDVVRRGEGDAWAACTDEDDDGHMPAGTPSASRGYHQRRSNSRCYGVRCCCCRSHTKYNHVPHVSVAIFMGGRVIINYPWLKHEEANGGA